MDPGLKQRLIGAAVLIALAVIFLPMLVQGPAPDSGVSDLPLQVPGAPAGDYVTRDLPLVVPEATTSAGLLADDGSLATVDTAVAPPAGDAASDDAADLAAAGVDPDTVPLDADAASVAEPLPPPAATPAAASGRDADAASRALAGAASPGPATPEAARPEPARPASPRPEPARPEPPAVAGGRLPAATAGGDYAVNFGAYATRADAGTVVSRLREAKLPAYVEDARVGGRDAWRVRIGPYASRAYAESARIAAGSIGSRATATVVALDAGASAPAAAASRPAPEAPAPAASAPAAGTGFAVQLGAFGNAAEADALRDRLRAAGITAFTDTVRTDKGTLTRVKAGPVVTRAEAEQLKARVKSSVGIDGLVRPHP